VITDVFSLAATSADELRWSAAPRDHYPHHRAEDIGPQVLGRLAELLGAGAAANLVGGFSLLAGESQHSPWVVSLPPELVEGIGALEDDEIEPLVNRWRRPNELATAVAPAALAEYLRGLSRFLRSHDGPFVLFIHTATGDR
jgi:hypothetical protein